MSTRTRSRPELLGTLSDVASAMASLATIAVSVVVITKCAKMLSGSESSFPILSTKTTSENKEPTKKGKERGWYIITGSYTEARCADPFIGVNGDISGSPYDESKVGRSFFFFFSHFLKRRECVCLSHLVSCSNLVSILVLFSCLVTFVLKRCIAAICF